MDARKQKQRQKMYSCVRQTENWSHMESQYKFDKVVFKPEALLAAMPTASPKLVQLFQIIADVDALDLKVHGHYFKHFIFSDVKENGAGAKVLAAAFMAKGYTNLVTKGGKGGLALAASGAVNKKKSATAASFGLLSSAPVYATEFSQKFKKKVLDVYNQRPENVHGDLMRFIILDSGFKEGIDLFDVKYVHIFEPSMSVADLKQTIGRATRTCGQKGLQFTPNVGWQLFVYNYYVVVPEVVKAANYQVADPSLLADNLNKNVFESAHKLADVARLYSKNNGDEVALSNLAEQLYKLAPVFSVDYDLTKNIHRIDDIQYLYDKYDDYVNKEFSSATSTASNKHHSKTKNTALTAAALKPLSTSLYVTADESPKKATSTAAKTKALSAVNKTKKQPSAVASEEEEEFYTAPENRHAPEEPVDDDSDDDDSDDDDSDDDDSVKYHTAMSSATKVLAPPKNAHKNASSPSWIALKKAMEELRAQQGGGHKNQTCHFPPASTKFLAHVQRLYNPLKYLQGTTKGHEGTTKGHEDTKRQLHDSPLFCKQVNFEWAKRAALMPAALHKMASARNKQKSSGGSAAAAAAASLENITVLADKVQDKLDIVPFADATNNLLPPPVKVDYVIVDYHGVVSTKLKRGQPSPPKQATLGFEGLRDFVKSNFGKAYRWDKIVVENKCLPDAKPAPAAAAAAPAAPALKGGQPLTLNPTQRFLVSYFTPESPYKGMLLWHSVGTGKTCSAIALATTSFEPAGYTILWVTRNTLKSDVYKNMFVDVCHQGLVNMQLPVDPSLGMPDGTPAEKERKARAKQLHATALKRLLSKQWIEPISYKTFSNMLTPNTSNEYKLRLQARNGKADILRKTLIIIDEAHKLYGGDLQALERPDMGALARLLQNSYTTSGADSARLLLMTATPITDSPLELFQLVNLLKERPADHIPVDLATFKATYMSASDQQLTESGIKKLAGQLCGHISYLNREQDPTQFAQPIMIDVPVMMSLLEDEGQRETLAGKVVSNKNPAATVAIATKAATAKNVKFLTPAAQVAPTGQAPPVAMATMAPKPVPGTGCLPSDLDAKLADCLKKRSTKKKQSNCSKLVVYMHKRQCGSVEKRKTTRKGGGHLKGRVGDRIQKTAKRIRRPTLVKVPSRRQLLQALKNHPAQEARLMTRCLAPIK